jgi:hypothetical protein
LYQEIKLNTFYGDILEFVYDSEPSSEINSLFRMKCQQGEDDSTAVFTDPFRVKIECDIT